MHAYRKNATSPVRTGIADPITITASIELYFARSQNAIAAFFTGPLPYLHRSTSIFSL